MKTKPLVIRDEIHGDMSFDGVLRHVIDHSDFQRLRYIKQLGLAEYVFPCANHTRFQHSLGAGYLAGKTFGTILKSWLNSPFRFEATCERTILHAARTYECMKEVAEHVPSREFWRLAVSMAGMLHDIGHGPYSHSFEHLRLKQDFSDVIARLPAPIAAYYLEMQKADEPFMHEDLGVLYIFQILSDLAKTGVVARPEVYFLTVATLVHRKLTAGKFQKATEKMISDALAGGDFRGGIDFHRLMRPLISGPFDVDRIDYIQRDGRNCGVSIGGIEWRRIVSKVIPCLAEHENNRGEPTDVCLISNIKNQHVLDDFIFSLFQMYTQLYMHPKIVGLEEMIKNILKVKGKKSATELTMTFEMHRTLSDEKFRELLKKEFQAPEIDDFLLRRPGASFRVMSYPRDSGMEKEMRASHFLKIDTHDRPMIKDGVGVFLFGSLRSPTTGEGRGYYLQPWEKVSPIARQFPNISYAPEIWIRMGE